MRLGLSPASDDLCPLVGGQAVEPSTIAVERESGDEPSLVELLQADRMIYRPEHGLACLDQGGLRSRGHIVAGIGKSPGQALQASRQVQVGSREVLLARRVVPEQERHPLLESRLVPEDRQPFRLRDERGHLVRQRHGLAVLDGLDHHRVARAPALRHRQKRRHHLWHDPGRGLLPVGPPAVPEADRVVDRNAELQELSGPRSTVLKMCSHDKHVRCASRHPGFDAGRVGGR